MALKKDKQNEQGISINYWVAQTVDDIINKQTKVLMVGFVNEQSRKEGNQFIERVVVGTLDGLYHNGEEIYSFAKSSIKIQSEVSVDVEETNFFVDAEDC